MANATDYTENKLVNHIFRDTAWTAPTTLYLGLGTGSTGFSDSTANNEVSTSGTNYSRKAVTCNTSNWDAPSARATANTNDISFPVPSASWGTIRQIGIFDAASGGNLLFWINTDPDFSVSTGQTYTIPAGYLTMTFGGTSSGGWSTYLAHEMLDHIFRGASFTGPANVYVGLHASGGVSESGITSEVTGGSYARVAVATTDAKWTTPVDGLLTNTDAITYSAATGDWGTVAAYSLSDASTSGNLLIFGNLSVTLAVTPPMPPTFYAGGLRASFQ